MTAGNALRLSSEILLNIVTLFIGLQGLIPWVPRGDSPKTAPLNHASTGCFTRPESGHDARQWPSFLRFGVVCLLPLGTPQGQEAVTGWWHGSLWRFDGGALRRRLRHKSWQRGSSQGLVGLPASPRRGREGCGGRTGKARALLVTGSGRLDTVRQSGESLAGRDLHLHLDPISVREWCAHASDSA